MARSLTVLFFVVFLAAPAFAGEGDAEQRFHDAYVQEVIEGEVAPAAKVYLALIRAPDTPAKIRAEAKFRFAVCTVLLGRPDEARVELAALTADDATPKSLKARAAEYLKTIAGIGVGSELDKKLQELVFDLARVEPTLNVETYREFEVIGKASLPFLRKLLSHDDVKLRRHAYRILARMGEPGLGARWKPEFTFDGAGFNYDLTRYFNERPEELRALEEKLQKLDDAELWDKVRGFDPAPHFSLAFLAPLVERGKYLRHIAFTHLTHAGPDRWTRAHEWIQSDDVDLQRAAARWMIEHWRNAPEALQPELFATAVRVTAEDTARRDVHNGLAQWAGQQPASALIGLLAELVAMTETWPADRPAGEAPVATPLAENLAQAVDTKPASEVDFEKYAATVKRWLALEPLLKRRPRDPLNRSLMGRSMQNRLSVLLAELPLERAQELCAWLFAGPARPHAQNLAGSVMHARNTRGIRLLRVALENAPAVTHQNLSAVTKYAPEKPASVEMARALVQTMPTIARAVGSYRAPLNHYAAYALALPPAERKEALTALLQVPKHPNDPSRPHLISTILRASKGERAQVAVSLEYLATTVIDVHEALWSELRASRRQEVVNLCLTFHDWSKDEPQWAAYREKLTAFVRSHLDAVKDWSRVRMDHEAFPLPLWVPVANPRTVSDTRIGAELADPAAREMTRDLAVVNESVMAFIKRNCTPALRTELFDRLLTKAPARVRAQALYAIDGNLGTPASPAAIESYLVWELARDAPKSNHVSHAAELLMRIQPSEKLFPASRVLLKSGQSIHVHTGIRIAKSLGRPELLPDLSALLDSMNEGIRTQAKVAMDSIRELVTMRKRAYNPPK